MLKQTEQKNYSDYDLKVLRYYAGYPDTGVISGAALNQATEFLIKSDYITASNHALTPKATALLNGDAGIDIMPAAAEKARALTLPEWQSLIGDWALKTFGPTPPAVHAARMSREMADVMDCIAIGDMENLGRALAGVMVVGLALADSQKINLDAALTDEHLENSNSIWRRDSWGQWVRGGTGEIINPELARVICAKVKEQILTPRFAAALLRAGGVSLREAIEYLISHAGCSDDDFSDKPLEDLTPYARGANWPGRKLTPLIFPAIVTGSVERIEDV